MKKSKKILIIILVLIIVIALLCGGVFLFLRYQNENLSADVEPVSMLNWGYWGDQMSSSGMVTNDDNQDVFLISDQVIEEVFVEEGQAVKIGDPLMSYDMTETNLKLEMQELAIQTIKNNIILAQRELERLKNETPIPDTPEIPEVPEEPEVPEIPETPQFENDCYNYVNDAVKPKQASAGKGTGTEEDPYVILCSKECYVEGSFLNMLAQKKKPVFVRLQTVHPKKNTTKNMPFWDLNTVQLAAGGMTFDEESKWLVRTKSPYVEPEPEFPEEEEDPFWEEPEIPEGHTAAELASLIKEQETELKGLDLERRQAELELEQMKKVTDEGLVLAEVDGIVKKVGDKDKPNQDGSPFISVAGSEGLYVTGSLSELQLLQVGVGTVVYANSWQSGKSFEATIQEISPYPSNSNNAWGEGNPNVSYYPYVAYIADTEGLTNGEYVDLTMTASYGNNTENSIYLQKAYVRQENGRSYVLKADENNRLVKQYVETGKTIYGEAIEIKSGLTMEDRIAFPYGKNAKEGVKVTEESETAVMY